MLKLASDLLSDRHYMLREQFDATHDFEEYIPHITLSYDIGDFDVSKLPDIRAVLPDLYIVSEFNEELKDVGSISQEA